MYVKTFGLNEEDKVNEFVDSVVLADTAPVQITDKQIVVFYEATKDDYELHFINRMKESLERNLFHERVRQAATEAEFAEEKDRGTNTSEYKDLEKRRAEITHNLSIFEAKVNALSAWTANKS